MPKFFVTLYNKVYETYAVEAEDAEDAGELVWSRDEKCEFIERSVADKTAWELDSVEEIDQ